MAFILFIYIYVYSSRRQNTAKIKTNRQTDTATKPQHHSNAHNIKNHIVLVLKCSYTTHVNSLKFMHITEIWDFCLILGFLLARS